MMCGPPGRRSAGARLRQRAGPCLLRVRFTPRSMGRFCLPAPDRAALPSLADRPLARLMRTSGAMTNRLYRLGVRGTDPPHHAPRRRLRTARRTHPGRPRPRRRDRPRAPRQRTSSPQPTRCRRAAHTRRPHGQPRGPRRSTPVTPRLRHRRRRREGLILVARLQAIGLSAEQDGDQPSRMRRTVVPKSDCRCFQDREQLGRRHR
jgi:hypothetical protein